MKRKTRWVVEDSDVRPARQDGTCFYCLKPLGEEHEEDCVIRQRTVVIKATIETAITVAESWDKHMIEFHRGESSWCASNFIDELEKRDERLRKYFESENMGCLCSAAEFEFLREATEEDEHNHALFIDDPEVKTKRVWDYKKK